MIQKTASGREFVRTPDEQFAGLEGYDFEPHYVDVDGFRVHYVDEGPGDGETVLMLHGEPTWSYLYRKMIPPVVNAGYRAIAPDLVGMGKSDKPIDRNAHTFEQQVQWVSELIDNLGLEQISLVCQDWGSAIGLRLVNTFIGLALGPYAIGQLSDLLHSGGMSNADALRSAIALSMLVFIPALFFLYLAQKHLPRDEAMRLELARDLGESVEAEAE